MTGDRDPLLDPPAGTPAWVPRVDDERSVRWLRWGALAVLLLAIGSCVVRSADRPADPVLGSPVDGPPGAAPQGTPPGIASRVPLEGFGETAVEVTDPDGDVVGWCVLLAETSGQRQRGLMGVTDLQGYAGMVFVQAEPVSTGFYMRGTPMPLSIAWFDEAGALVSTADMEPCADVDGCPTYAPGGAYRYALEVPQGQLPAMAIAPGARLEVGGACAPRGG